MIIGRERVFRYVPRRYNYVDPPYSLWWYYPGLTYYPRYRYYYDAYDSMYWRRYRDPYYERPLWYPYRPWAWESMDVSRSIDMYKKGLITFSTLDRYWLQPSYWDRKTRDYYRDLYIPSRYYGPRRYFYRYHHNCYYYYDIVN